MENFHPNSIDANHNRDDDLYSFYSEPNVMNSDQNGEAMKEVNVLNSLLQVYYNTNIL